MKGAALGVVLVSLLAARACSAQAPDTGNANSAPADVKPVAEKAQAKAEKVTPPAAKSAAPAQNAQSAPAKAAAEKPKPKKVWTNDEIGSIHGSVSVIGDPKASESDDYEVYDRENGSDNGRQNRIDQYRDALEQLRGQIEAVDTRIAELKNFKAQNADPSGGINIHQGYNMVPVEDQVKQLEGQKKKLEERMNDLEDRARKEGLDPGDLR